MAPRAIPSATAPQPIASRPNSGKRYSGPSHQVLPEIIDSVCASGTRRFSTVMSQEPEPPRPDEYQLSCRRIERIGKYMVRTSGTPSRSMRGLPSS